MTMTSPLAAPVSSSSRPYRVIFTHVPKVAGTSVMRRLVHPNYTPDRIKEFRGVRDLFATRRAAYDVVVGHSVYGIHHFMSGDYRYFTFLRDPVERAVSHYFFIKQPPWNPDFVGGNAAQKVLHNQVALADIFDRTANRRWRLMGTWLIDNMQTRYLAGWTQHWRAPASRILLKKAKRNLRDRYTSFGLQDRFDESIAQISGSFDWKIAPDHGRKSKQTRIEKIVSEADMEAVRRNNLLDAELYDYACELFRQRAM